MNNTLFRNFASNIMQFIQITESYNRRLHFIIAIKTYMIIVTSFIIISRKIQIHHRPNKTIIGKNLELFKITFTPYYITHPGLTSYTNTS